MKRYLRISGLSLLLASFVLLPGTVLASNGTTAQTVEYISALGETPGDTAYNKLIQYTKSKDPVLRAAAVQSLGKRGEAKAVAPVVQALKDNDKTVRMYAVISIRTLNAKEEVKSLKDLLDDPDPSVRSEVLRSYLGLLGSQSLSKLVEGLKDDDHRVRSTAAECLGELSKQIGSDKVISHLTSALADPHKTVRTYSARALASTGDKKAAGPLQALLSDPELIVRETAADALRQLGVEVPAAAVKKATAKPPVAAEPGVVDLTQDGITGKLELKSPEIAVKGIRLGDDLHKASKILGPPQFQNVYRQTVKYPGLIIGYGDNQRINEISISAQFVTSLAPPNRELLGNQIADDDQLRQKLLGQESEITIEEVNIFGAQFKHYIYSYENRGLKFKVTEAKGKKTVAFFSLVSPSP